MSLMRTFEIGSTGLVAQSIRLNTTASNIANVETLEGPDGRPYRGRQVVFRTTPIQGAPGSGVEVANIVENDAPLPRNSSQAIRVQMRRAMSKCRTSIPLRKWST